MEYVVIGICILAVAVIVALLIDRKKRTSSPEGFYYRYEKLRFNF